MFSERNCIFDEKHFFEADTVEAGNHGWSDSTM